MPFYRSQGRLLVNEIPLSEIADKVGTPCYVYCWQDIESRYQSLQSALAGINANICYAVKANSNLTLLRRMAQLGAGFDIVSGGELERVLYADGDPAKVVFSGVGKSREEISFALKVGIGHFNVESEPEAQRIDQVADQLGVTAKVVVRVNPDISVDTHQYITTGLRENKFGLPEQEAIKLAMQLGETYKNCVFQGVACHIGSQLNDLSPYESAIDAMLALRDQLQQLGLACLTIDLGGGFGICYDQETPLSFADFGALLANKDLGNVCIEVEPGRSLVGEAGILLTHVEYLKRGVEPGYRNFCVVNAAMNDLIRPALYQAYHKIENVESSDSVEELWHVVGPICETGDFLGHDRKIKVSEGDLLAVHGVGAYGFTLSSNYNSRPRVPEVLVDQESFQVVRRREFIRDLIHLEQPLS